MLNWMNVGQLFASVSVHCTNTSVFGVHGAYIGHTSKLLHFLLQMYAFSCSQNKKFEPFNIGPFLFSMTSEK